MRGRAGSIVIALLAAAGFAVIVRLGGGRGADDGAPPPDPSRPAAPPAAPAPAPAPAPPPEAVGPEATPAPGEISVLSLLGEMVDLEHLARLPRARFTAGMAASTDRRSRRPEDGDSWFANDDFVTETLPNLVRVETAPGGGKRYVLADVTGPGAIVRIWSATPLGTLRLYVDDASTPLLEAPMAALLRGDVRPFTPPLAQVTARGHSLYFPFPFARRCVITVDDLLSSDPFTGQPMKKLYYQIGYRRYGAEHASRVRPYSAAELARAAATIARVAKVLRDGLPAFHEGEDGPIAIERARVLPGRPSVTTIARPGGAEIAELLIMTPERHPQTLRSTRLRIAFDGETTVDTPLPDFFGTGPALNSYTSLPMTVAGEGLLICRFRMPFGKHAVLTIARNDPGAIEVGGHIAVKGGVPFGKESLLFHAGWREHEVVPTRPFRDWHIAGIKGVGHQVGTVLGVDNPPDTPWWGGLSTPSSVPTWWPTPLMPAMCQSRNGRVGTTSCSRQPA